MKRIIFKLVVTLVITLLYFNIGIQGMKDKESYEQETEDEWEDWEDEDEQKDTGAKRSKCTWDDLEEDDLSAIKLYLFSKSAIGFTRSHLRKNELSPSEVLQKLQEGLLKIKPENYQCKYGHSKYNQLLNFSGIKCNICSSWCGDNCTFFRCNDCSSIENKTVCPGCFEITKFGPNTREALKHYLHKKTGKEYQSDLTILQDFLKYIKELNWPKRDIQNRSVPAETPHLHILKSIQNGGDFDFSQLEKINILCTEREYTVTHKIPPKFKMSTTMTFGFSNEKTDSIENKTSERYTWSCNAGTKNTGIKGGSMVETWKNNISSIVTNFTHETIVVKEIEAAEFERVISIMTYYGTIESTGEKIEYMDHKDIKISAPDDPMELKNKELEEKNRLMEKENEKIQEQHNNNMKEKRELSKIKQDLEDQSRFNAIEKEQLEKASYDMKQKEIELIEEVFEDKNREEEEEDENIEESDKEEEDEKDKNEEEEDEQEDEDEQNELTCTPGCEGFCGYNWYERNWDNGNPTPYFTNKTCACCGHEDNEALFDICAKQCRNGN